MKKWLNQEINKLQKKLKRKCKNIIEKTSEESYKKANYSICHKMYIEQSENQCKLILEIEDEPLIVENEEIITQDHSAEEQNLNKVLTEEKGCHQIHVKRNEKLEENNGIGNIENKEIVNTNNFNDKIPLEKENKTDITNENKITTISMEEKINTSIPKNGEFQIKNEISPSKNDQDQKVKFFSQLKKQINCYVFADNISKNLDMVKSIDQTYKKNFCFDNDTLDIYLFEHRANLNTTNSDYKNFIQKKINLTDLFANYEALTKKLKVNFLSVRFQTKKKIDLLIKDIFLLTKHTKKKTNEKLNDYNIDMFKDFILNQYFVKSVVLPYELKENFEYIFYFLKKVLYNDLLPYCSKLLEKYDVNNKPSRLKEFYLVRILNCYKNAEDRVLLFQLILNIKIMSKPTYDRETFYRERHLKVIMWHLYLFNDEEIKKLLDDVNLLVEYFNNFESKDIDLFECVFNDPIEKYKMFLIEIINNDLKIIFAKQKILETLFKIQFKDWNYKDYKITKTKVKDDLIWLKCVADLRKEENFHFDFIEIVINIKEQKIVDLNILFTNKTLKEQLADYRHLLNSFFCYFKKSTVLVYKNFSESALIGETVHLFEDKRLYSYLFLISIICAC